MFCQNTQLRMFRTKDNLPRTVATPRRKRRPGTPSFPAIVPSRDHANPQIPADKKRTEALGEPPSGTAVVTRRLGTRHQPEGQIPPDPRRNRSTVKQPRMVEHRPASVILGGVEQIAGPLAHHGDNARDVAMQIGPALKCCGVIGKWSQGQDRQPPRFECGAQCNDAGRQGGPGIGWFSVAAENGSVRPSVYL